MLVSALYNIVDQIFIGQSVGMLGNAATNVAFPLTTVCTAIALLLGIGGAADFNLSMGARKKNAPRIYRRLNRAADYVRSGLDARGPHLPQSDDACVWRLLTFWNMRLPLRGSPPFRFPFLIFNGSEQPDSRGWESKIFHGLRSCGCRNQHDTRSPVHLWIQYGNGWRSAGDNPRPNRFPHCSRHTI